MSAQALFAQARAAGLKLAAAYGTLVVRGPAAVARAWADTLRQHKSELLALLSCEAANDETPAAPPDDAAGPPQRACQQCSHRTKAGTCGKPVQAGLAPHFVIRWPEPQHAAHCPAFERQPSRAEPHPYERDRRAWTSANKQELLRMQQRFEAGKRWGLSDDEADLLSDTLHWRDRTADDRHACMECRHLRAGTTSRWYCVSLHDALPQQRVLGVHRCGFFTPPDDQGV